MLGVLGGGQLGWMLALAAAPLGVRCRVLDPSPEAPAGRVADLVTGAWDDPRALDRLADGLDVVTYEFENVPVAAARRLAGRCHVWPPPRALEVAQDRVAEKTFFESLGIAVAPWARVDTRADLEAGLDRLGGPAVLKTRRLGYDGKGQHVIGGPDDVEAAWAALGGVPLVLEGFVSFDRELSVLAVRGRDGATACYPLVETVHAGGILRRSLAPAPDVAPVLRARAEGWAGRVLETLGYVGVVGIELFEAGGRLLANELAPRVHNSGHWTIEGAETSQFENHVRAVLGLPLGSTAPRGSAAMLNLVGAIPDVARLLAVEGAHLHLYGKPARPGRKLGHVTVRADDPATLQARVERLRALIDREPARPSGQTTDCPP